MLSIRLRRLLVQKPERNPAISLNQGQVNTLPTGGPNQIRFYPLGIFLLDSPCELQGVFEG